MDLQQIKQRYTNAVNCFIEKLKDDQNIISVIVCGSLSYDTVWEKSDVDMTVIVRDQQLKNHSYCIVEDGIIINVYLIQRSDFRRGMERNIGGSISHSFYSKGQVVYTTDESIKEYFEELKQIGIKDQEMSIFKTACELVGCLNKAEKWLKVRNDYLYSQYYILKAVSIMANMELILHNEIPTRESILRAKEINPELIKYFYEDAMSYQWNYERLSDAIKKIDEYLVVNIELISKPLIEFLSDNEVKSLTDIAHFTNDDTHFVEGICEYLSDKGVIEKVSKTIRITPKSRMAVEEVAYLYFGTSDVNFI